MNSPAHAAESLIDDVVSNEDGNHEKINFDSVSDRSYFLRGFQFYTIDIKSTPKRMLDAIIRECEAIEKACWVPQENFYRYALQKDLLTYVMKDGKMAAFQIASYWILGQDFIFDLDETMVMKEYRGNNLAFALAAINCRTFYLKILKSKNIKK